MFWAKFKLSYRYIFRIMRELFLDIWSFYTSPYAFTLIIGAFRRIRRRLQIVWLPKRPGRPPIDDSIIKLIIEMKRSNWIWGNKRISQELQLLGISAHKKTVARILKENGIIPPKVKFNPVPWKTLTAPYSHIWGMDFTCKIDSFMNQIFILVIIDINTRQFIWKSATLHPTREWLVQQFRNISIDCFDFPEALIIDNDGIYGKWISPLMKSYFEIKVLRIPKKMPICNGRTERYHKTLKDEILNRVIIHDTRQVHYICCQYLDYYNRRRPHQSLDGNTPIKSMIPEKKIMKISGFRKISEVGGLIMRFELAA